MYKVARALDGWRNYLNLPLVSISGDPSRDQLDFVQECVSTQQYANAELWSTLLKGAWSYNHQLQTGGEESVLEIEWLYQSP